ncbi:MAG: hypothetical protein KDC98_09295 [Planctomycetes bacterium]|nr:hypothetical protein [Planctomycetota bacterium]
MTALILLLSCLSAFQEPEPRAEAPAATRLDVIELKNGEIFEGRITTELDGYVQFELDHGAMVGIARNRIARVRRAAGALITPAAPAIAPRDEWFILHDASGAAVGWLHAAVVVAADGSITANEEYEFADGQRRYQVTSICSADHGLTPQRCYFRERQSEPMLAIAALPGGEVAGQPDRVVDERIVDARIEAGELVVVRVDGSGQSERRYPWQGGPTFPLLARAVARATGAPIDACPMFDPASEEITLRSFAAARPRAVTLDGELRHISEVVESGSHTANAEWLDAGMVTVRRELAGPALVAVPTSARRARGQVGQTAIPAALAHEAGGAFGLWVPNPAWRVEAELPAGQVALTCDAHAATIGLVRIDHLAADTMPEMAADAVTNWFHLMHPGLAVEGRERVTVRDRAAIRIIATGTVAKVRVRATVDVIPDRGQFLVLTCRAPASAWSELAADFAAVLRTIEFEPKSIEPPMQGPLRDREPKERNVRIPIGR